MYITGQLRNEILTCRQITGLDRKSKAKSGLSQILEGKENG
jgi:hypothetical protein